MSLLGVPVMEALYCLACAPSCLACMRWAYKRCTYTGADDSASWTLADRHEVEEIPRMCRLVLMVYEEDVEHPRWEPPGGYQIPLNSVVKRVVPAKQEPVPPYAIYLDHEHTDVVLAIRGLNLRRENDYLVLWDNKLGKQKFDDGYLHHGLLKGAVWLLNKEKGTLADLRLQYPTYTLTFAGHSLGSGIASLMAVLVVKFPFLVANPPRKLVRCFAFAPARCMSLNLAIKYADVINSVILQDDFLPRTATPLEDIFRSIFCLPCLLCYRCLKDTCISEQALLRDPRRLYVPGRIYHIVERKFCSCIKYPPEVRTGIPVEGRFEHIVLSCNATTDHSIVAILREAQKAGQILLDKEQEEAKAKVSPEQQKMTRQETRAKEQDQEHKAALKRAATLDVARASDASSPSSSAASDDEAPEVHQEVDPVDHLPEEPGSEAAQLRYKLAWDQLVDDLFPVQKTSTPPD